MFDDDWYCRWSMVTGSSNSGMAVVGVWVLEVCEAYCDLLRNGGLIASVAAEDDDE